MPHLGDTTLAYLIKAKLKLTIMPTKATEISRIRIGITKSKAIAIEKKTVLEIVSV